MRVLKPKGRNKNDAIVTEAKPRLQLQHSCPDPEVSKPSSDSHRSLTDLEHAVVQRMETVCLSLLDRGINHHAGWLFSSEFELAVAADPDKHPELPQGVTVVNRLCSCIRLS